MSLDRCRDIPQTEPVDREEFFEQLGRLNRATVGEGRKAPHKPLLLLWLLGRLQRTGSSACTFAEADAPVSALISEFGPRAPRGHGAAMPFVHLEGWLWQVRGSGLLEDRRAALNRSAAAGSLSPEVESLLRSDAALVADTARFLIDQYFTDSYLAPICASVGLDLEAADSTRWHLGPRVRRPRDPGFRDRVLHGWRYRCAMCGYDGALGNVPAGLEAAHIRWHSQGGPDAAENGLALCELHHALFDLGVLGLTDDLSIEVSARFSGRSERADQLVYRLHGRALLDADPRQPEPSSAHVGWHHREVFKGAA